MIVYLNSHDFPESMYTRHTHGASIFTTVDTRDIRTVRATEDMLVSDMVHAILNDRVLEPQISMQAQAVSYRPAIQERSIWRLIINSHGNVGRIAVGEGLSISNVHHLAELRPYFTPLSAGGHGVLIDACLVASDEREIRVREIRGSTAIASAVPMVAIDQSSRGRFSGRSEGAGLQFLRAMSTALQTKVTAGIEIQQGPNGIHTGGMEGSFIRVFPNGTYQFVYQAYQGGTSWSTIAIEPAPSDSTG
jgi:hypothetical protein